jgi:predicted metal-dependent phosphoesterase TrpH
METSTINLTLAPDAAIDLQVHTVYSDGSWIPEQLLDYLVSEQFGLVAITDHDRTDTVTPLQRLALEKQLPVLVAVEMTASWKGEMTDILCYSFDPEKTALSDLAHNVLRRQQDNTREVYENLLRQGYTFAPEGLTTVLEKPGAQQPHALVELMKRHGYGTEETPAGKILSEAGCTFATNDVVAVVDAAHQSEAVCIIAHPGRTDGFVLYDAALLDELRQEAPVDGIEVYYPKHTPEQVTMYLDYAQKHHLLISSGSDSHGPDKKPIKYRAELSRSLLERVGIQIR